MAEDTDMVTSPDGEEGREAVDRRRRRIHQTEHAKRIARLSSGVYGVVQKPVLPRGVVMLHEPPDYISSRRTVRYAAAEARDGVDRLLDKRCFFTGVELRLRPLGERDMDARKLPWIGTKDHLVPARRDVPGMPVRNPDRLSSTMVWASNIANVTLGLAPLPVRLKVRQWLMTAPFDRQDTSTESGINIRWLIIEYLETFRIKGRFPWSRREDGNWWNPEISNPFMARMFAAEDEFLALDDQGRNEFINRFNWHF